MESPFCQKSGESHLNQKYQNSLTSITIMSHRKGSMASAFGGEVRKISVSSFALEAAVLPSTQSAAFETESALQEHYKPIKSYEGYHRYDPNYTWSWEDEKRIIRKVRSVFCVCYRVASNQ
jgi:hypothetical protein